MSDIETPTTEEDTVLDTEILEIEILEEDFEEPIAESALSLIHISLWWMLLFWATPMIVAPPLFSRDVFSYAAQGEMTFHHISPYLYGPGTLGGGPYVPPVDQLWINSPAPYGPFFLFLDGKIDWITQHNACLLYTSRCV